MLNLDANLIETTVGVTALCANCISRISDLGSRQLIDVLPRLIGSLRIISTVGQCNGCLRQTVVHRRP
jgi:hypothetical protein